MVFDHYYKIQIKITYYNVFCHAHLSDWLQVTFSNLLCSSSSRSKEEKKKYVSDKNKIKREPFSSPEVADTDEKNTKIFGEDDGVLGPH